MRTYAGILSVFTLLATTAAAQSTTEEGIRAMLRGEYQAAARILRPLADDSAEPDPVAQFFLAMLYATGHGVGGDEARACGLFLRSAARAHPFTEQSAAIAASMRERLGAGASLLCVADESWNGGPPQAFDLGPDHRVVFAETSISVIFGDSEQRNSILLPVGAVYLPVHHTTLDVTRPRVARRHFFQWFVWTPDTTLNPSSWTLAWMLSEVVGDQWIPIAHEKSLVIVKGARPASSDVSNLVRLRLNASGEAEFTLSGEMSRTEVISWQGSR